MFQHSPLQRLAFNEGAFSGYEIFVKRDDLLHEVISGNKWRKLKLNIGYLQNEGIKSVITFGGAFSNHLSAVALCGEYFGVDTVGIIRGEQGQVKSDVLDYCISKGMRLEYVSRSEYKRRNDSEYLKELRSDYPDYYVIPEGGANEFGVQGCADIVNEINSEVDFDYVSIDCGTGATLAGMVKALTGDQKAIGVQVLKGADFITPEVNKWSPNFDNFEIWTEYHFGGYARYKSELIDFMRWFYSETSIKLDPVYTGKQFYAIFDQLKKGYFSKSSKIVLVHSGGLQGILGFEKRYSLEIY